MAAESPRRVKMGSGDYRFTCGLCGTIFVGYESKGVARLAMRLQDRSACPTLPFTPPQRDAKRAAILNAELPR